MKKIEMEDVNNYGKFAVILKCLLMKKSFTQGKLAETTGLSEATITHYIKGKTTPSKKNLAKIADALGVSVNEFYTDIKEYAPYMNNNEETFSYKLNQLLSEKGITQAQLAKEIGVTRQSVNLYTTKKEVPSDEIITRIAEYFGITKEALLEATVQKKEPSPVKIIVSQMPTKISECPFLKGDIINDHAECLLGDVCDLNCGVCSRLIEGM